MSSSNVSQAANKTDKSDKSEKSGRTPLVRSQRPKNHSESGTPTSPNSKDTIPPTQSWRLSGEKHKVCPRCYQTVTLKAAADHRKLHYLQEQPGQRVRIVSVDKRCKKCAKLNKCCQVAAVPSDKNVNTFNCLRCLSSKEGCSYYTKFLELDRRKTHKHPIIESTEPSSPGNSADESSVEQP